MKFHSARTKIDRAKKHIAEVESIVRTLPDHSVATIEINPNGGNEVLKHDLLDRNEIITNIALALGDAIHNLHCALDHAWASVLTELSPASINGQTKFPIRSVRNQVEAALRGIKIDGTAPTLFNLVLGQIKPYLGGNESIWSIHILDIDDKHRLLLPVIEYASIHGIEVEDQRGKVTSGSTWGSSEKPPYYVHIPLGYHFKEKGTVAFSVLFDEGPKFQFADLRDMLWVFIIQVVNTVQALENIVPIELGRRATS